MKVSSKGLASAFIRWIENDLMAKSNLFQQGILTFIVLQGKSNLTHLFDALNMLSKDGYFQSEELYKNLYTSLEKMGGVFTLPYINYNLDKEDLRVILSYVQGE